MDSNFLTHSQNYFSSSFDWPVKLFLAISLLLEVLIKLGKLSVSLHSLSSALGHNLAIS